MTVNVNKFFNDYKQIYEAIMHVQHTLNGPLLDGIGLRAQTLFNEVSERVNTPDGMSRKDTIVFLKKLRSACIALKTLSEHLVVTINQELSAKALDREMEIDVNAPEIIINEIDENIETLGSTENVQVLENDGPRLVKTPNYNSKAA